MISKKNTPSESSSNNTNNNSNSDNGDRPGAGAGQRKSSTKSNPIATAGSSGRTTNFGDDKWVNIRVKNRNPNQPQVIVTGKIGDNAADTIAAIGS